MYCLSAVLMFMLCGVAIIHVCHAWVFLDDPIEKVGVSREDYLKIHRRRQPAVSWPHVLPPKKHNNKGHAGRRGIIEFEPSSDEGKKEGSRSSAVDNEVDSNHKNSKVGRDADDGDIVEMDYNPAHRKSPIHGK
ncbi:PREDICTED: uncharacterized protein LOC109186703 [Ipomoea nil]|uniref:uncharacterized protein LOC109186703 n=1 Tax=Ipomoea nil TaxID=35883 RepID=UPI0009010D34|nr:PREDICTED: uncharacterized protein LOC109186703 [Ipomoea nil]